MIDHCSADNVCWWLVFLSAWMIIGMIGSFLFILIQLVLIVDFAHAWNEKWVGKYEDTQSKAWLAGMSAFCRIVSIPRYEVINRCFAVPETCILILSTQLFLPAEIQTISIPLRYPWALRYARRGYSNAQFHTSVCIYVTTLQCCGGWFVLFKHLCYVYYAPVGEGHYKLPSVVSCLSICLWHAST